MTSITSRFQHRTWTKEGYLISTDPSSIPVEAANEMLGSDNVYWAKSMPDGIMLETLQNSLCFGLYSQNSSKDSQFPSNHTSAPGQFIGLARCVTDYTTFLYLTDVYILPGHQGSGLGKWLVGCVQEVIDEMPYLRRSMLFTSDWKRSVPFYEGILGMEVMGKERGEGVAVMQRMGPGFPGFVKKGDEVGLTKEPAAGFTS
ncbi:related to GNAT family N-acetyltransferase [Phialocephala subalpina]|uniref:Related to GNAT family N-acetyltransferase n=1 Tax=Phialocephala subalpina TaxID=576137 RepID=A0A1L7XBU7_9HELO|nr:related to GNAT family N-acetyltransferase [Phialocephala subalpina]